MVRQLVFVVVTGFIAALGGTYAVAEADTAVNNTTAASNATGAVTAISGGLFDATGAVLLGLAGLVAVSAVLSMFR
jgi:hypothetical protein